MEVIVLLLCSQVQILGSKDAAAKFVTSGADGRLVFWDIKVCQTIFNNGISRRGSQTLFFILV